MTGRRIFVEKGKAMIRGCSNHNCAVKGKTPGRCLGIRKHTRGACRCVRVDAIEARISVQGHPVGPRIDEFHDRSVICAWLLSGGFRDILALVKQGDINMEQNEKKFKLLLKNKKGMWTEIYDDPKEYDFKVYFQNMIDRFNECEEGKYGAMADLIELVGIDEILETNTESASPQIVECEDAVIEKICQRREMGRKKYGTTMERTDLSKLQWLQHAQEEAMDLAIYLERCMREEKEKQP